MSKAEAVTPTAGAVSDRRWRHPMASAGPGRVSCPESRVPRPESPVSLSERELAHIWEGQRFPAEALATRDGQRLRVVYRGRAAGGPGPDYRDAIIAAPPGLLQGDVELHVRSSDFRRHGHHRDAAYDGVALHVVFWQDEGGQTLLASGRTVPVVALGDWVAGRARELRAWLERPALWQEPCRTSIARLGAAAAGAALDGLGDERFRAKAAAFARRLSCQPAGEALWQGLLEALGYGGDRRAFRALAERLSWAELRALIMPWPAPARADEARRRLAARFAARGLLDLLTPLRQPAADTRKALERALTVPGAIGPGRAQEILANAVLPMASVYGGGVLARAAAEVYAGLPLPVRYGAVRHLHRAVGDRLEMSARRQQGMLQLLRQYCTQGGCGRCPLS